ncbi:Fur family transcriptional regulator [Picosynechococcus sp. OG1]|uniref:Fur family transcriptional regulator n=2 Tax=Cyanobacteriota TaxID=1117 RepID=UPI00016DC8F6|nr:Fur family transcriptional regulator [Picosynechococcus sp. OG1]ACA99824.1 transcriptional regulator, Fur family [Picosynechococcus sp. PCC 7002]
MISPWPIRQNSPHYFLVVCSSSKTMSQAFSATEIRNTMKQEGLRITPQRFAVYANLLGRQDHPTVEQILEDVNADLPIASKASVYSALTVLREVNLVREVLLDEGVTRYDANVNPHHHFVCRDCGAIQDLPWQAFSCFDLGQFATQVTAESYEVTVKGLCADCRA